MVSQLSQALIATWLRVGDYMVSQILHSLLATLVGGVDGVATVAVSPCDTSRENIQRSGVWDMHGVLCDTVRIS